MTRVIGIGSPFGDDAIGFEVARMLAQSPPPGCEVVILDRPGAGLIESLDYGEPVIIVDAVKSGAPPGTLHRLIFDELENCSAVFVSSHEIGVVAALRLARKLGRGPSSGGVLGIEIAAESAPFLGPLTAAAQNAVESALPALRSWIQDLSSP